MSDGTDGKGLSWDTSAVETHACRLVGAAATADSVVLTFGTQATDHSHGHAAVQPRLIKRIALRPASAKHLRDLLGQVAADLDKSTRRSGS